MKRFCYSPTTHDFSGMNSTPSFGPWYWPSWAGWPMVDLNAKLKKNKSSPLKKCSTNKNNHLTLWTSTSAQQQYAGVTFHGQCGSFRVLVFSGEGRVSQEVNKPFPKPSKNCSEACEPNSALGKNPFATHPKLFWEGLYNLIAQVFGK